MENHQRYCCFSGSGSLLSTQTSKQGRYTVMVRLSRGWPLVSAGPRACSFHRPSSSSSSSSCDGSLNTRPLSFHLFFSFSFYFYLLHPIRWSPAVGGGPALCRRPLSYSLILSNIYNIYSSIYMMAYASITARSSAGRLFNAIGSAQLRRASWADDDDDDGGGSSCSRSSWLTCFPCPARRC